MNATSQEHDHAHFPIDDRHHDIGMLSFISKNKMRSQLFFDPLIRYKALSVEQRPIGKSKSRTPDACHNGINANNRVPVLHVAVI